MSDGSNMTFLEDPPSDVELAAVLEAARYGRLNEKAINVFRRLAFQRDRLLSDVASLKEANKKLSEEKKQLERYKDDKKPMF